MSGGYFDRNIYAIGEIVASIERIIARALRPKTRENPQGLLDYLRER